MIKPQYLNIVTSSFLLWLDDYVLSRGGGFTTGNLAKFYPISSIYNGYYAYSLPFKDIVANESITPPMTGVYINNSFVTVGNSGLAAIDYKNGITYFTNNMNNYNISGIFPLKDINVSSLNVPEEELLFETKFELRSKYPQNLTGLNKNTATYPILYVRSEFSENTPFCLGGMDNSITNFGVYMFCDSQYQLDALKSMLADANKEYVPLFTTGEMPYNKLGGFKNNINFNYDTASAGKVSAGSGVLITDVQITSFKRAFYGDFSKLNPDVYWAIADFTLSKPRYPRSW